MGTWKQDFHLIYSKFEVMKKLSVITFLSAISLFTYGQDIDMTDYEAVAEYYVENFYSGKYTEAMSVLVKDGRANGIEIRCVEMGSCETQEDFEYKLYGEKVSKVENQKSLLIYWTETSYIEITLEMQDDESWLVVGSPSKPSEKAKAIRG